MKKIAIFVEGQTEQFFVSKLLQEIAGRKNISVTLYQLRGGSNSPKQQILVSNKSYSLQSPMATHEALIYDCGNDEKVKSDILEEGPNLKAQGYSQILGIRDLFPQSRTELTKLERGLKFIPSHYQPLPLPHDIIVAVMEIEAWFLAECNHYGCIDANLSVSLITSRLGFNPDIGDMTLRRHPAQDLDDIYHLVGKAYRKEKKQVQRTVECLDYAEIYLNPKSAQLTELVKQMDVFLS
jgi:hypothetical protein